MENIIICLGRIQFLVVDGELSFTNNFMFEEFLSNYKINKVTRAGYAAVEVRVGKVKENIRKMLIQNRSDWGAILGYLIQTINTTPTTAHVSPEMTLFGNSKVNPNNPIILDYDNENPIQYNAHLNVSKLILNCLMSFVICFNCK